MQATINPATGEEKALTMAPGRLLRFSDAAARLERVEPADLTKMVEVSQYWVEAIAGISATPLYRLLTRGGQPPSGDSLELQESALVAKVERKQVVFGDGWESVIGLSVDLWNAMRPADALATGGWRLDAQWQDPRSRSVKMLEAEKKLALGIPEEQIWAELGYGQGQVDQFREWREERERKTVDFSRQMREDARRVFDGGMDEGAGG